MSQGPDNRWTSLRCETEVEPNMDGRGDRSVEDIMLADTREDLAKADHKASLVLAALGVGVGAALGGLLAGDWKPTDLKALGEIVWWVGAVLLAGALLFSGRAVWPRYDAGDASAGIYYWAHVATFKSLASLSAALDATPPKRDERTRNELWLLSRVVKTKYECVRWSIALAGLALVAFALSPVASRLSW